MRRAGFALGVLAAAACGDDSTPPNNQQTQTQRLEVEIANVGERFALSTSGAFDRARGAAMPGPLMPGESFEIRCLVPHQSKLSFATMFVESNDLFYAPNPEGLTVWTPDNQPITGDVTAQIELWDAGTEVNQEPGLGPDQAPRQAAPNSGAADPNPNVRLAEDTFGNLPAVEEVLRATLGYDAGRFVLTITNVSNMTTLKTSDGGSKPVPLSPGTYLVHAAPGELFASGAEDRGEGLEAIAEDGNQQPLAASAAAKVGLTVPISPGVFAVSNGDAILFQPGAADRGEGLERIAEDGMPGALATSLAARSDLRSHGAFDKPVGAPKAGPAMPGQSYRFTIEAAPGDKLFFATMFVPSNDYIFAPNEQGIELFDQNGAINTDVTSQILLWDLGTEQDGVLGMDPNQAPFQAMPNVGPAENGAVDDVQGVDAGEIRVRIAPEGQLGEPA
jgi:hypothetical protein